MFTYSLGDGAELRLPHEQDAVELSALINKNREHLRKWLPWVDATKTPDDSKVFIAQSRKRFAENNGFDALIMLKGKLVGVIGYHQISWANKNTAIGYWVDQDHQGKGLITRSLKAFLDYGFDGLGLNRIEICCATQNTRSRSIPERLGCVEEGVRREAEKLPEGFVDSVIYGMLAAEWREKQNNSK